MGAHTILYACPFLFSRADYAAIWRHASAHLRHASAQRLHCSPPHFSHSAAQRSQMSAHALQNSPAQPDSRQQLDAQSQQIRAQSMQTFAQPGLLPIQFLAQASHSFAHAMQASMHACISCFGICFHPLSLTIRHVDASSWTRVQGQAISSTRVSCARIQPPVYSSPIKARV